MYDFIASPPVIGAIAGGIGGLARALFGRYKNSNESFDRKKFAQTLLVSGGLGMIYGFSVGGTPQDIFLFAGFADVLLEDAVKALVKTKK